MKIANVPTYKALKDEIDRLNEQNELLHKTITAINGDRNEETFDLQTIAFITGIRKYKLERIAKNEESKNVIRLIDGRLTRALTLILVAKTKPTCMSYFMGKSSRDLELSNRTLKVLNSSLKMQVQMLEEELSNKE